MRFPPGCAHGFQHFHLKWAAEALHLHKVDDVLNVSEQLASLLMLVCLALGGCEQGRGGRDRWQLVEIAAQQLGKHTPQVSCGFMYAVFGRSWRKLLP